MSYATSFVQRPSIAFPRAQIAFVSWKLIVPSIRRPPHPSAIPTASIVSPGGTIVGLVPPESEKRIA